MKRRVAIPLLAAATVLLVIAMACSSNPVVVAKFECVISDAGDSTRTCPAGQYCELMSCGSTVGDCVPIGSQGCATSGPECGCDGVTYYNECVREKAQETRQGAGQCSGIPPQTKICGPGAPDCAPGQSCAFLLASPALIEGFFPDGGLAAFIRDVCQRGGDVSSRIPFGGVCWSLPDTPASSGASRLKNICGQCDSDLAAIGRGGPVFPCPADASAD